MRNKFLKKQYDVHISQNRQCIELHSKEQSILEIKTDEILNFNYFRPKQFVGNDNYWLNLKTKKNGTLFFSTQFSDESFLKNIIELLPQAQLEKMGSYNLTRLFYYYVLPLVILGLYFVKVDEKRFNGLLVIGLFLFVFNTIAIYNEYEKFKKYKKMKESDFLDI